MPQPPVASTVLGARTAYISPVSVSSTYAPTQRLWPGRPSLRVVMSSITIVRSRTSMAGCRLRVRIIAASHFCPVMSPAWKMRRMECPPSRPRSHVPSSFLAKRTPQSIRSRMPAGASLTMRRTTASSQRPAPATRVSCTCAANVSAGSATQQMPPWAKLVLQSSSRCLVARTTRPAGAR